MGVSTKQPRGSDRLSDTTIRAFIRKGKSGKLGDGRGLYLTLTNAGTPVWRLKYRLAGKEKVFSIGPYPGVGLKAARAERERARSLVREGTDPVAHRQIQRITRATAGTVEELANRWLEKERVGWSAVHARKSREALERDVFPVIGHQPIHEVTTVVVANVITRVLNRGVRETAAKLLQHLDGIFRYAQGLGLRPDNPCGPVKELLPRAPRVRRRPALLDVEQLREVLRLLDTAKITPAVRLAHRLVAFSAQRIGTVISARWDEFDLGDSIPTWRIPREKMKKKSGPDAHVVVLGATIARELRAWRMTTGGRGYLFPSPDPRREFVSHEALEKVFRVTLKLRDKHTCHGWRASFNTLARDAGYSRDVVAMTLDHVHDDEVRLAYDRGERREERVKLATWWDALLAPPPADVLPMSRTA